MREELLNKRVSFRLRHRVLEHFEGTPKLEELARNLRNELPLREVRVADQAQQSLGRVLDLETLVRAKEAMNRDHDRITVRQLREIQRRTRLRRQFPDQL